MARTPFSERLPRIIAEMTGKISDIGSFWSSTQSIWNRTEQNIGTVDYSRNDYDLFRAIYFAAQINKKGVEYQLAAPIAKPIVNIMAGFVIGEGVTIELDNPDADQSITDAEAEINDWLGENMADLYDYVKFGYRDGDAYVHMDEMGEISLLEAKSVTPIYDAVSGKVNGYDVREEVDELDPVTGKTVVWIYLKQYRSDSTRILRWESKTGQQSTAEVVFEKVFTAEEGAVTPTPDQVFNAGDIVERKLPIKHFANEAEPRAIYGNSELQNVLVIMKNYSGVLLQATKGAVYNSTPIPVIKGVKDKSKTIANAKDAKDNSGSGKLQWDQDSVIYLSGDNADAKFLQANAFMPDVTALLEIFFYLFVQGSETPEFAFGTAVPSSMASVSTQMPILVRKITRKQRQLTKVVKDIVETYIEKQQLLSNPTYLTLKTLPKKLKIRVNYPAVADEDKTITLAAVEFAIGAGIISNKTALELILGDKVKDASQELKDAARDVKAAAKAAAPSEQDRLIQQMLSQNGAGGGAPKVDANGNPVTPTPAPAPSPAPSVVPAPVK